jgi:DNA-binding MarR family transcriptional regulator
VKAVTGPVDDYRVSNRIFFRLFQLGNTLQTRSASLLGVTAVQWAVLGALSAERSVSGIALGDLAEYLMVSRQNLDGVLKRLERDGYVERTVGATDRRARIVRITPKGRDFWDGLERRIGDFYRAATVGLGGEEKVLLSRQLDRLQSNLKAMGGAEPQRDEPPAAD